MSGHSFASGHCLCGKVRYKISSEPLKMAQCHCDHCRYSTGTGHMSLAFFDKETVTTSGETSSYTTTSDSGAKITRHFCPECGSRLFATNDVMTSIISIAVGCLDDNTWFKPQAIVYNKHRPAWDFMDESLPSFEEMPPQAK